MSEEPQPSTLFVPRAETLLKNVDAFLQASPYEEDFTTAYLYLDRASRAGRRSIIYTPQKMDGMSTEKRHEHTAKVYDHLSTRFLPEKGFAVTLVKCGLPCPECRRVGIACAECPCQSLYLAGPKTSVICISF